MGSLRACIYPLRLYRASTQPYIPRQHPMQARFHRSCADYSCKWDCSPSQQFTTERASNTPILPAFLIFLAYVPPFPPPIFAGGGLFRNFSRHQPGVRSFPNGNIRGTSSGIQSDQIFVSFEQPGGESQLSNRIHELSPDSLFRVSCEFVQPRNPRSLLVKNSVISTRRHRERVDSDPMRLNVSKCRA